MGKQVTARFYGGTLDGKTVDIPAESTTYVARGYRYERRNGGESIGVEIEDIYQVSRVKGRWVATLGPLEDYDEKIHGWKCSSCGKREGYCYDCGRCHACGSES